MGSCGVLPLQPCSPPGDPPQLQFPEHHLRVQTDVCRGTPCIIWIDSGLNIVKAGKDLIDTEMKVISALNVKFATIKFRVTLPKHHAGIGAVERIIGSIKNTVSKSLTGPHQLKMDDEELLTWIHLVIDKLNNRPLILGAPLGITLTPTTYSLSSGSASETRSTLTSQSNTNSPGGELSSVSTTPSGSRNTPEGDSLYLGRNRDWSHRLATLFSSRTNASMATQYHLPEFKLFSGGRTETSTAR